MKHLIKYSWAITVATVTAVMLSSPVLSAAPVIVFGDGWANVGEATLQARLQNAGYAFTTSNLGIEGQSADSYANAGAGQLTAAVQAQTDARWVVLSVGIDDLNRDFLLLGSALAQSNLEADLNTLVAEVAAARSGVRVLLFAYDYSNYLPATCTGTLAATFGVLATQADANQALVSVVGGAMNAVATANDIVDYVPVFGAMQIDGLVVGAPDPSLPSPLTHMANCDRPNVTGFTAVYDALIPPYFGAVAPVASATVSNQQPCSGDSVLFTSQSSNAAGQRWLVDGVFGGDTGTTFTTTFNTLGPHDVRLEVYNQAYTDSATVSVVVQSCMDAGVPDNGMVDTGDPDLGAPDNGNPDTGVPDNGNPDVGVPDNGNPDLGVPDNGNPDMGNPDTGDVGNPDMGNPDMGDVGNPDIGNPDMGDVGNPDMGNPDMGDAGNIDMGPADTGVVPDTGAPDTGTVPDTGVRPDTGTPDTGAPDTGAANDAAVADSLFDEIGVTGSGCSCETERRGSDSRPWGLLVVLLSPLLRRRRRR